MPRNNLYEPLVEEDNMKLWKPAPAPLMTRWAKDVRPDKVRPEYPRPQAERRAWLSLNGLWEFAFDDENVGQTEGWTSGRTLEDQILVPYTFEAPLSGIGRGDEIHERVWYRRIFDVPAEWDGKRLILHFGAVDWQATVWVNGREVGSHVGGYTPFSLDITDALAPEGPQELVVAVFDPAAPADHAFQPVGKQLGSEGIWYTRSTGIWQTVWLEPVNEIHISGFSMVSDLATGAISLKADVMGSGEKSLAVQITRRGKVVASARLAGNLVRPELNLEVPNPDAWSPENPALYQVTLTLRQGRHVLDQVRTYCAFRTVEVRDGKIMLNGEPYFLHGVLDQGYWPDGIYTAPTDEALKNDVMVAKAMGFNLSRKHAKVEEARWYYHCDKLGLLVAQDMPSSQDLGTEAAQNNFKREWIEVMDFLTPHPSVVMWLPFNENWGDPGDFQDDIAKLTQLKDRSRIMVDASGWTQRQITDLTDIHDYTNDLAQHAEENPKRPIWIGEFGGIAMVMSDHQYSDGWGYQSVTQPDVLVSKIKKLVDQLHGAPGIWGYCYTQLTDVEQELNGLMTYDRVTKVPPEQLLAVFRP